MPTTSLIGLLNFDQATYTVNYLGNNSHDIAEIYGQMASHIIVAPFAGVTSPQPALFVQSRQSKIVSRVPKSAVWALFTGNLLFIFLGLGLGVVALILGHSSKEVYQVQARLNVTGLAAQLFEKKHAEQNVKSDQDLFEEKYGERDRMVKRVVVERTNTSGASFTISEGWEG